MNNAVRFYINVTPSDSIIGLTSLIIVTTWIQTSTFLENQLSKLWLFTWAIISTTL